MKQLLKKTVIGVLLFAVLVSLASCTGYIKQTEEEARVTVRIGDEGVCYDLYRYFFLGHFNLYFDGDFTAYKKLSEEEQGKLYLELKDRAVEDILNIYAVIALFEGEGLKRSDFKKAVKTEWERTVKNFGGMEKYEAFLKEQHMTDEVFRLLLEKQLLEEKVSQRMTQGGGKLYPSDMETVENYILSDDVVNILWITQNDGGGLPKEEQKRLIDSAYSQAVNASPRDFRDLCMQYSTPGSVSDLEWERGIYVGHRQMDAYYEKLEEAIFALDVNEVSPIVETSDGYFIIRRYEKNEDYIRSREGHDRLIGVYLQNAFYETVDSKAEELKSSLKFTAFGESLTLQKLVEG